MFKTVFVPHSTAMEKLGAELADACSAGNKVIFLHGDLGAGKTTLVRGFLRAMGYQGKVKSPTYTLVESYVINNLTIHHFDLYRLHAPEELENIGIRDYLSNNNICLIEWPEKAQFNLPVPQFSCYIDILTEGRHVTIKDT